MPNRVVTFVTPVCTSIVRLTLTFGFVAAVLANKSVGISIPTEPDHIPSSVHSRPLREFPTILASIQVPSSKRSCLPRARVSTDVGNQRRSSSRVQTSPCLYDLWVFFNTKAKQEVSLPTLQCNLVEVRHADSLHYTGKVA